MNAINEQVQWDINVCVCVCVHVSRHVRVVVQEVESTLNKLHWGLKACAHVCFPVSFSSSSSPVLSSASLLHHDSDVS